MNSQKSSNEKSLGGDKYADFKDSLPDYVVSEADFDLYKMRHSAEHVLHQVVQEEFPKVQRAMGPATKEGFYMDFNSEGTEVSSDDFKKIQKRMQKIINQKLPITRHEVSAEEARKLFKGNKYKQEWIDEAEKEGKKLTVYWTGEPNAEGSDVDLCKGPHVGNTNEIKAVKLLSIAGAYWRGDEKNEMLTRIYGTAFFTKDDLREHIEMLEEAKKRDHRKIGKQQNLFTFSDLVGPGLPLYTPKGALIRKLIGEYVEELQTKKGYSQVWTPQIAKAELFKTSGHYDKYKEDMFRVHSNYSDDEFYLKPMNCPQHTQIYSSVPRSYRDLPVRFTDFAMLYRDEKPGELSGLARVRSFSQDDCHIFCREDQVDEEIDVALSMTKEIMKTYGFKYRYRLSTRDPENPDNYLGDPKTWDKVEKWAVEIMKRNEIDYYDGPGEAAFYAPKMDLMATDALGREWQLSTVQIDYVMPARFGLTYTDENGKEQHPVMIHRAISGSLERFMMVILEHFKGALPAWLHPTQVAILPVGEKFFKYAESVKYQIEEDFESARVEIDNSSESLGKKIRNAQVAKVPYILVVGGRDEESKTVSVRLRTEEDLGAMSVDKFVERFKEKVESKALDL